MSEGTKRLFAYTIRGIGMEMLQYFAVCILMLCWLLLFTGREGFGSWLFLAPAFWWLLVYYQSMADWQCMAARYLAMGATRKSIYNTILLKGVCHFALGGVILLLHRLLAGLAEIDGSTAGIAFPFLWFLPVLWCIGELSGIVARNVPRADVWVRIGSGVVLGVAMVAMSAGGFGVFTDDENAVSVGISFMGYSIRLGTSGMLWLCLAAAVFLGVSLIVIKKKIARYAA